MTAEELVESVIKKEQEQQKMFSSGLKNSANMGMKQLLSSILEQEKDHERRLGEALANADMDDLFHADGLARFSFVPYEPATSYKSDISTNDFLNLIIEYEEKTSKMYSDISELCTDDDTRFLFTSLAFEENKHKTWAVDRYELEMISGF